MNKKMETKATDITKKLWPTYKNDYIAINMLFTINEYILYQFLAACLY